jgi:hypothetical protein
MEARVARLESDVAHLLGAVAEIKAGLLALRDRVDERMDRLESKLEGKLDSFKTEVSGKLAALESRFDSLESRLDRRLMWAISLNLAFGAGILGAMARGFGWL